MSFAPASACGTSLTDSFRIYDPLANLVPIPDTAVCEGFPVTVTAPVGAASYQCSNGVTALSTTFHATGRQWLRTSDGCGNAQTDSFSIVNLTQLVSPPALGPDTFNCLNGRYSDVRLEVPQDSAYTFIRWSTGAQTRQITVRQPGLYWVEAGNQCITHRGSIRLLGCPPEEVPHIDMPTAFSPNGDGLNDVFRVPFPKAHFLRMELRIYNRWGECISVIRNVTDGGDGRGADAGVYYYRLRYLDSAMKEHEQKGDVTLIR